MTRILIIDDHPIVRRGVRDLLRESSELQVSEAANGPDALSLMRREPFDLILLDLDLPGMDGLDVLKQIKREHKRARVLVLSIYPEDQFAVRVLKAGAAGFLSKDAATEQLLSTIRKILGGTRHISDRTADLLLNRLQEGDESQLHEKLSDREFQILCLFGEGQTVKQIAQALNLSPPTISTYRARILDKMGMRTTAEIVKYAIQHQLTKPA
jgi:DNA-binding NarL/FixJ family response regulator